jgi:formate hydrogenlyase subunit 4
VAGEGEPSPHDLGDAPEAAGFEFSGWHLALWDYARALRFTLFLALMAALVPGPPAVGTGVAGSALRAFLGVAELAALCVALAAVGGGLAVLRPERLPALGVAALALAAVAAALLLLGGAAA